MMYREYGAGRRDTILLLHGGGLSWWNYRKAVRGIEQKRGTRK